MSNPLLDQLVDRFKHVYAFYVLADDIVCVKYPESKKYFIRVSEKSCSCPGFGRFGHCKHLNIALKGTWTPSDGLCGWLRGELEGIFDFQDVPEPFNTLVLRENLPLGYPLLCFTVTRAGYSAGVEVRNPETYEKFFKELRKLSENDAQME